MGKKEKREKVEKSNKKLVVVQEGGIGLAIVATGAIRKLREANPGAEITVVSPYTEIFYNNPHINYVYAPFPPGYLYERHCKDADEVFLLRPDRIYTHALYRRENQHVSKVMLALLGISTYGENARPEMNFYEHELVEAQIFMSQFGRPVVLIQQTGATSPIGPMEPFSMINDKSWDVMSANKLVSMLKDRVQFIQVRLPREPAIMDTYQITASTRKIVALMLYAATFVAIDSFLQHSSAIFQKPGVVLWGPTNPANLGYAFNVNLRHPEACPTKEIHCRRPETHLFDYMPGSGQTMNQPLDPWRCSTRGCMKAISADEVSVKIHQLLGGKQKEERHGKNHAHQPGQPAEHRQGGCGGDPDQEARREPVA